MKKEIQAQINTLKAEVKLLESQLETIKKETEHENKQKKNADLLKVLNLPNSIYIPKDFEIGNNSSHRCNNYFIKYDEKYLFEISDRPDESYPDMFYVTSQSKKVFNTPNNIPLLLNIFYKSPDECEDLTRHPLNEKIDDCIRICKSRARKWDDKLSFGIAIMYYWIRIYYQSSNDTNKNISATLISHFDSW